MNENRVKTCIGFALEQRVWNNLLMSLKQLTDLTD